MIKEIVTYTYLPAVSHLLLCLNHAITNGGDENYGRVPSVEGTSSL